MIPPQHKAEHERPQFSGSRPQNRKQGGSRNSRARARQEQKQANRTVLLVLLAILAVGLLIRGFTMNWQ